jgi:hypothetical protein
MSTDATRKRISDAPARAALLGLALQPLDDGSWLLSCPRVASSLRAVEAVLCALEAARVEARAKGAP